ncbi:MAG: InlB B-repeat-containing protein [Chitinispirillaceae bacterium]|nr:InlB B-repeat-containing protein [Chitinispirillaceae bacterium]
MHSNSVVDTVRRELYIGAALYLPNNFDSISLVVKENDSTIINTTFTTFNNEYFRDTIWYSHTFSTPGVRNLVLTPYSTPALQPVASNISIVKGSALVSTITFLKNSATASGTMPVLSYSEGDSVRLMENSFVNSGYSFSGWAITESGPVVFTNKADFQMGIENVTLYAIWVNTSTYNVTFNKNHTAAQGMMNEQTIITGKTVPLNPNEFSNTGWVFTGWATSVTGTVLYNDKADYTMKASNDTLYAIWTQKAAYTITFNSNGGTGSMVDQSIVSDMSAELSTNTFTYSNWVFAGWATSATGAVTYSDKATYTMATGNDTLYAIWTQNPLHKITFNSNGGTGSMAEQSIASGMSVPLSANTFTNPGLKFSGWNTSSNGSGTPYANGDSYTMDTSDAVLYAQWSIAKFTITFNSQGGSAVVSQTIADGEHIVEPVAPTFENYCFGGWYTEATCVNVWNFSAITVSNDDTLFAKWNPASYTVTYDDQGATTAPVPASQTVTSPATTIGTLPTQPQKSGYTFGGWYTAINGGGTQFTSTTIVTASDTVFAKWTQNATFTLTISATNGSVTRVPDLPSYESGTVVTLTPLPAKDYHFTGWGGALTGAANPEKITINEAKSVTANFEKNAPNSFALTVLAENGSVKKTPDLPQYDSGTTVVMKATPSTGYRFVNWTGDATGSTDSVTVLMNATKNITANFVLKTYALTVNVTNGTVTKSPNATQYDSGTVVSLTATPAPGYQFTGWAGALSGTTNPASITMNRANIVTANFALKKYTLTINSAGGTVTKSPDATQYDSGTVITLTATPAPGYQFTGWAGALSGATNPASITMNGTNTVTANFTLKKYALTINSTNGTIAKSPNATQYDSGTVVTLTPTANSNYTFSGWSGDLSGTTNPETITMNSAKSITANFSISGPIITTRIENQSCPVNDSVTFTVNASGFDLSYRWYENGMQITNAAKATYTTVPLTINEISTHRTYRCVVGNTGGKDSCEATLSVATVTDYNTNTYHQVKIGTQIWMMENLRAISLNDGTPIPREEDNEDWPLTTSPIYCYYENSYESAFIRQYGALYNWYAVNTGKLAPTGWRVPSLDDWNTLITFVGENAGKLKETGIEHWLDQDEGATNESGFTALPGSVHYGAGWGWPYVGGRGGILGDAAFFWTSVEGDIDGALLKYLCLQTPTTVGELNFPKYCGLSVRCIKN